MKTKTAVRELTMGETSLRTGSRARMPAAEDRKGMADLNRRILVRTPDAKVSCRRRSASRRRCAS